MCIIVDACCAGSLNNPALPQAALIIDWVRTGGKIILGGKLADELRRTSLLTLLAQWSAAGRLINIAAERIEGEVANIDPAMTQSNDRHVLALARLSGTQVVVTRDNALMQDLKNREVAGRRRTIYPFREAPIKDLRINRAVLRSANCGGRV